MIGIIHCDFEDDLCNWAVSTEPESSSERGWQRKTSQQLIEEGYVGPTQDHNGFTDHYFVIAGKTVHGDEDDEPMITRMTSPGFVSKEQKHNCLNFWFYVEVSFFMNTIKVLIACFNQCILIAWGF